MANDASKVKLIKDGEIWLKRYNAEDVAPTDTSYDPSANGYVHVGYYSDEGFTLHLEPGDTTTFKAQNGETVLEDDEPGFVTVAFSGLETRKELVEAYFNTTVQPDGSFKIETVGSSHRYSLILRGIDQSETLNILAHLPLTKVSDREDMTFNPTTLKAFGLTFQTFKEDELEYHLRAWDSQLDTRPVVTGATPPDVETGDEVTITGYNFTGATNVKFGTSNAADFDVVSDTEITAEMPSGSAGSAAIKVITPAGESNAFAYTRGGNGA